MDAAGNLYGTTYNSFDNRPAKGSVFRLSPSSNGTWTESVLFTFSNLSTGLGAPSGVVLDSSGNIYGTTPYGGNSIINCSSGCGVVYKLTPSPSLPWNQTILYYFTYQNGDGANPLASLTFDLAGNLYGTASLGGSGCAPYHVCGAVFKLAPAGGSWTESILYSFTGPLSDGTVPTAPVIVDSAGKIYGTTSEGGVDGSQFFTGGIVFQINP
jgi:hypothetical protein